MKKDIIIIGPERSGKTLFAKMIFEKEKTLFLDGRRFKPWDSFPFDNGKEEWNYDNVLIDDIPENFPIISLIMLHSMEKLAVNRLNRQVISVKKPRFIYIATQLLELELTPSIIRRFHVVDSSKTTISDLMKLIEEEELIIKTHW